MEVRDDLILAAQTVQRKTAIPASLLLGLAFLSQDQEAWEVFTSAEEAFMAIARSIYQEDSTDLLAHVFNPSGLLNYVPKLSAEGRLNNIRAAVEDNGFYAFDQHPSAWTLDPEVVPELWYRRWQGLYGGA